MIRTIVAIAILLFTNLTFSQTTKKENYVLTIIKGKVVKENKQIFWLIPTTLSNNTKDTLKYFSMSCSWQEFYSVDNKKLQVQGTPCEKNIPKILTLAPWQSETAEIKLLINQTKDASEIKFKIGFNLIKATSNNKTLGFDFLEKRKNKNVIWSNLISI